MIMKKKDQFLPTNRLISDDDGPKGVLIRYVTAFYTKSESNRNSSQQAIAIALSWQGVWLRNNDTSQQLEITIIDAFERQEAVSYQQTGTLPL